MAEIVDLERVISNMSGFDVDRELKRSQTLKHTATLNRNQTGPTVLEEEWGANGFGGADLEKGLGSRDRKYSLASCSSSTPTLHDAANQVEPAEENDPNIVSWNGPDDPENPMARSPSPADPRRSRTRC